jgi:hypothetical protein
LSQELDLYESLSFNEVSRESDLHYVDCKVKLIKKTCERKNSDDKGICKLEEVFISIPNIAVTV